MIWLITAALAQEPQVFEPQVADVKLGGISYSGILVDEATFAELGELRIIKRELEAKLDAHTTFEVWSRDAFIATTQSLRDECVTGQSELKTHYETTLERERKKDLLQRHGFTFGIALGLVGATGIYIGATHFYGQVLTLEP